MCPLCDRYWSLIFIFNILIFLSYSSPSVTTSALEPYLYHLNLFILFFLFSNFYLFFFSNDICNPQVTSQLAMCPLCDRFCRYWSLADICFHAKFTYLVDNPATVFFAVFMSFWGEFLTTRPLCFSPSLCLFEVRIFYVFFLYILFFKFFFYVLLG